MFFLSVDFSPIKPDFGLIMWTTIIFGLFWFIMSKYAFRPIAEALKSREDDIQSALDEARKAREEMADMKAENEKILAQAREERAQILKEAKDTKNSIINEAKDTAKNEANKIITNAKAEIVTEKAAAMAQVKNEVGTMALMIAEQVMKKDLKGNQEQESLVSKLMNDIKLN